MISRGKINPETKSSILSEMDIVVAAIENYPWSRPELIDEGGRIGEGGQSQMVSGFYGEKAR